MVATEVVAAALAEVVAAGVVTALAEMVAVVSISLCWTNAVYVSVF